MAAAGVASGVPEGRNGHRGAVVLLLAFGVLLLVGVLVSSLAHRTVLSTSVLFLAGGALLGRTGVDVLEIRPGDPVVA